MHHYRFMALAAFVLTPGLAFGADGKAGVEFVALPMEVPDVVSRSNDLGQTDPDRVLHVAVSLPYGDPVGIQAFVDSVSDPASPNYRQFLTPEQVGAQFGLPDAQLQSVVQYLQAAGFTISLVGQNHLSILADGTVAQAQAAFHTTIHEFQAFSTDEPGNTRYFSYTTVPTLPTTIAGLVIDITGLENFTKPQPRILTPTQARTLYSLAPIYGAGMQGQGRTVAISSWDGYRLTNVPLYYSQYALPTPPGGVGSNITVVTISGGSGSGTPGGEGDLDIQMALGMAPLCNFRIYDGGGDLISVLTSETNDNLSDTISESYGWNLNSSTATSAHNLHVSMSAQGITYMAASGDNGTTIEPYSYPDYEPEVLMVGGTVATVNGSGVRTSEVSWSGSGSGWSTKTLSFNVLPSWQHGTNVPTNINKRLVPDVALNSSGSSGAYYFYFNGHLSSGAIGTSFASPVFAGSLAVAEQKIIAAGGLPPNGAGKQRFGRIQDLFYSQNGRSDVWFDITSGSGTGSLPNGSAANPGPAWDFCTGWGAINFNAFATTQSCPPPVASNPTGESVCAGGPASFSVTAGGTGPYSYQWRKNTVNIGGATSATYSIAQTVTGDAGSYDCMVTNSCMTATSTAATLTVSVPPTITQQPTNATANVGDSASFSVTPQGQFFNFSYQWRKDGSNLSDNGAISGSQSQAINIDPVAQTDAGSYDCVVTTIAGSCSTTSDAATLTVNTGGCFGDLTGDNIVDLSDLSIVLAYYGQSPVTYQQGDLDGNGQVDLSDIAIELSAYGTSCP